jgi:hypothetical protein
MQVVTLGLERYNQNVCLKNLQRWQGLWAWIQQADQDGASDMWFYEQKDCINDLGIRSGNLKEQFCMRKGG